MGSCNCKRQDKSQIIVLTEQNEPHKMAFALPKISGNPEIIRSNQSIRKGTQKKKLARQEDTEEPEAETATIQNREKSISEKAEIVSSVKKVFLFQNLTNENIEAIIREMKLFSFAPNQIIFNQGSKGKNFYIVRSGTVIIEVYGQVRGELTKCQHFGEVALIHNSLRNATARTSNEVELWGIDRDSFREVIESINQFKHEENMSFIKSIPIFEELTEDEEENLVSVLVTLEYDSDQKIVNEGDPGELFYIIKEGEVACTEGGNHIRDMTRGDFFGEQALIHNISRTASVTAKGHVIVLSLDRKNLNAVLGNSFEVVLFRNSMKIAFERSSVFNSMNTEQIDLIISRCRVVHFEVGQKVIETGEKRGERVLIVLKGSVKSVNSQETYQKFSCIGDTDVFEGNSEIFREEFVATSQSTIAEVTKYELESVLGGLLNTISVHNKALRVLKEVNLLRNLSNRTIEKLAGILQLETFENGQTIVEQGAPAESFYIVKEGKVDIIVNGQMIRQIGELDYFGERSILLNENRSATVRSAGFSECWVLSKSDFLALVGEGIRSQLLKRIELQDDSVQLSQLKAVKTLGKGSFGNVYLAVHTENKIVYATKTILRSKIGVYDIYEGIKLERRILLALDHPFIVKLVKTFKDDKRLYFLMEYVRGQELFDSLRVMDLLSEEQSKFYISCIVLILEHLHERKIVYRDLKPENIMVDEEGYLKLIDFGTAKILNGRTYTVIGTPHYMAPEVLTGKGYSISVDWWSMGIMLFEFICGKLPFGDDLDDPYAVYKLVLKTKVVIPPHLKRYPHAAAMVELLLNKNPAYRNSVKQIKAHDWLSSVDWDTLLSKHTKPPYVPKIGSLESEAQKALKNPRMLVDSINKEEVQELTNPPRGRFKEGPPGWDDEF